jgi:hypothetical protein
MADGFVSASEPRRTFLVQAQPELDILLRVLSPFAVQGAQIVAAEMVGHGPRVAIRVEVRGLPLARAELLCERLRAMPSVLGVGLGWRAEAQAV